MRLLERSGSVSKLLPAGIGTEPALKAAPFPTWRSATSKASCAVQRIPPSGRRVSSSPPIRILVAHPCIRRLYLVADDYRRGLRDISSGPDGLIGLSFARLFF